MADGVAQGLLEEHLSAWLALELALLAARRRELAGLLGTLQEAAQAVIATGQAAREALRHEMPPMDPP